MRKQWDPDQRKMKADPQPWRQAGKKYIAQTPMGKGIQRQTCYEREVVGRRRVGAGGWGVNELTCQTLSSGLSGWADMR